MKNKLRLLGLIYFSILVLAGCAAHIDEISIDNVQSISVTGLESNETLSCSEAQIKSFVKAYNSATLYTNDVGTTHPYSAKVIFEDGTTLVVWGGTQGFCTMDSETTGQQNIKSSELDKWFSALDTNHE